MRKGKNALEEFMSDFSMHDKAGIICFDAEIEYSAPGIYKKFPGEVHIQKLSESYTIYLLDVEVKRFGIPDVYAFSEQDLVYDKDSALIITAANNNVENQVLKIYPTGIGCKPYSLKELRQKILN